MSDPPARSKWQNALFLVVVAVVGVVFVSGVCVFVYQMLHAVSA